MPDQVAGHITPGSVSNQVQAHEDVYVTMAAAAGAPDLKEKLLKGHEMNGRKYKVHLDGFDNTDHWTGKSDKSARRAYFYYDETDLMAIRVDAWKMHIGVKMNGLWWDPKAYPNVPYIFNLLMDPMEKMDQESHEFGSAARRFFASKMWALNSSAPFIQQHLETLMKFPPSQGADTLSMKKALDEVMKKLETPHGSSN